MVMPVKYKGILIIIFGIYTHCQYGITQIWGDWVLSGYSDKDENRIGNIPNGLGTLVVNITVRLGGGQELQM